MGWGAVIGAVGSIAGSAIGAATKGGGGGNLAELSSRINENAKRFLLPFALGGKLGQDYWNINVPSMAQQSLQFGYANAPQLNQFNLQQLQGLMGQAMPGWQNLFGQMQTNTQALLQGQIPQDVQDQIQRSAAYQGLVSGVGGGGAGTGMEGRTITARDLGLTSLGLEQQGFGQAQNLMGFARNYLMPQPVSPTSLLPLSDLISASEWGKSAFFQANEAAFNARVMAANAQVGMPSQGIGGTLGGISGGLQSLFTQNPKTGQSPFDFLLSKFGGGGGSDFSMGLTGSEIANMPDDFAGFNIG